MTSTMLGELARLFGAESRDRIQQTVGATAIERTAHMASAHRLQSISNEFKNRQIAAGLFDTLSSPNLGSGLYATQPVQNAATSISNNINPGGGGAAGSLGALGTSLTDLTKRASDTINQASQNAQGAGQQAQQAGDQASQASSTLSTVVLASAVGLGLFLLFTRK